MAKLSSMMLKPTEENNKNRGNQISKILTAEKKATSQEINLKRVAITIFLEAEKLTLTKNWGRILGSSQMKLEKYKIMARRRRSVDVLS